MAIRKCYAGDCGNYNNGYCSVEECPYPGVYIYHMYDAFDAVTREPEEKERRIEAYKVVLEDLAKFEMFRGIYDAEHGNAKYMFGVGLVMETISREAKDYDFMDTFYDNMAESNRKLQVNRD